MQLKAVICILIVFTVSCTGPAPHPIHLSTSAGNDTRLEHAILAFVTPDGRTVHVVSGHQFEANELAKHVLMAVKGTSNNEETPSVHIYSSGEELRKALGASLLVVGARVIFNGTCQDIPNQYPSCTDINDPGPGVTWRHDLYSFFKHCVPDSQATNTCSGTYMQVGVSRFFADKAHCDLNVGATKTVPIMDYFCD